MAAKPKSNQVFVNDERTVMVQIWPDGEMVVATRDHPSHTWSPPVTVRPLSEVRA